MIINFTVFLRFLFLLKMNKAHENNPHVDVPYIFIIVTLLWGRLIYLSMYNLCIIIDIFLSVILSPFVLFRMRGFFKLNFIYVFLAVLGLCALHRFSLVASVGYPLAVVCRLVIMVASLGVEHGLWGTWASVVAACGLSSCISWAVEHRCSCGAWD